MCLIDKLKSIKSLSIVGIEKNTGKTETLNYVIKLLKKNNYDFGLTSIGIDGESVDQVTNTKKPNILIPENTYFTTSESHFKQKQFLAEIFSVSEKSTSIGRLVTAKSLENGKILLSGPQNVSWLKQIIENMLNHEIDIVLVDGAISRLSLSSPNITDAMILATGAAFSLNMNELIKKTKHTVTLINLEKYESNKLPSIKKIKEGIFYIDNNEEIKKLPIESFLHFRKLEKNLIEYGKTFFIKGALTNNFFKYINTQKNINEIIFVVDDYTKIFVDTDVFNIFLKKGGKLKVLEKTNLIAVTVNPTSPSGYSLNKETLKESLQKEINVPVINVLDGDLK